MNIRLYAMGLQSTQPAKVVIATVVHDLARDFLGLAEALVAESRFARQVSSTVISDEFSRFKLWAGNIAAHRKGRRSLEYRYFIITRVVLLAEPC